MYKTEWEYLKKQIEKIMPQDVKAVYCGAISKELTVPHFIYDEKEGKPHTRHDDSDYDAGSVWKISVGPFDVSKPTETKSHLKQLWELLEELGYSVLDEPFGRITDGWEVWTICFKRGPGATLRLLEMEGDSWED